MCPELPVLAVAAIAKEHAKRDGAESNPLRLVAVGAYCVAGLLYKHLDFAGQSLLQLAVAFVRELVRHVASSLVTCLTLVHYEYSAVYSRITARSAVSRSVRALYRYSAGFFLCVAKLPWAAATSPPPPACKMCIFLLCPNTPPEKVREQPRAQHQIVVRGSVLRNSL
jgi:hypothetical protein